jgi:hypothetical protein
MILTCHRHAGNVRFPVSDVNDVFKRNRTLLDRHMPVDGVGKVLPTLVNSKQKLSLGGVVDEELWECGNTVMIVVVLGCKNISEIFSDADTLQYFPEPRGNDVVV